MTLQLLDFNWIWCYHDAMIRFTLRFDEALHKALQEQAKKESRSLHNLIMFILKAYVEQMKKKQG
jgi:predicted HicB family RNase H-like nuclease